MTVRYMKVTGEGAQFGFRKLCREHGTLLIEYDIASDMYTAVPLDDLDELRTNNAAAIRAAILDVIGEEGDDE